MDIFKGELYGFIGQNGAGKSTTIESIIGIKPYDKGEILLDGWPLKKKPNQAKASVGYVSSEPIAYEDMTGINYVAFIASIYKVPKDEFNSRFEYLCKRFSLKIDDTLKLIKEYSHGMKQKICLIASLIYNPKIWILDEPTVGLDVFTSEELISYMQEYVKNGNTILVASHNIELISRICDKVSIIHNGTILKTFDLKSHPEYKSKLKNYFLSTCKEDNNAN